MKPYLMLALAALPLAAEIVEVRPRRTRDYDERANQGWCSIRVWVDDEVNIFVEGDRVVFESVRGRASRDAGSECSQPLPRGNAISDFQFRGIDGRGEVKLIEEPGPRNRYRAWVRILDRKGGGEEHHFKLNWKNTWTEFGAGRGGSSGGGRRNDSGRAADTGSGGRNSTDRSGRYFDDQDQTWKIGGDGVCFYRDRDFRGDALCAAAGEHKPNMGRVLSGSFQSMRLFGRVREVEAFEREDYAGAGTRLAGDQRDLGRVRNWRGVQSFRVN